MMTLRDFLVTDVDSVQHWIHEIDAEATAAAWVHDAAAEPDNDPRGRFTRAIVVDGELVGAVLLNIDSWFDGRAEIGFVVHPERRRSGLAAAAVSRICDDAFGTLGLHRVWGVCDPSNVAAAAVFRSTRFLREGRLVDDRRIGDRWHDSLIFGRIAPV